MTFPAYLTSPCLPRDRTMSHQCTRVCPCPRTPTVSLVPFAQRIIFHNASRISTRYRSTNYYSCHLCTTGLLLYRSSSASFPVQELSSLGLSSPCIGAASPGRPGLNTVSALNAMYELLQIHRRSMCTLEELEKEHLKKSSSLEHMQTNNSRLKARMRSSGTEQLQTPCNFKGQWSITYRQGATD